MLNIRKEAGLGMIEKTIQKAHELERVNREFFRTAMPPIYEQLTSSDIKPSLLINPENGRLGLADPDTGHDIYDGDSVKYASQEISRFKQQVNETNYRDRQNPGFIPHLIQPQAFHKTQQLLRHNISEVTGADITNMDLVVFGIGLGFHVENLINQHKYRRIILVERDISRFKASLYCVNWKSILTALPQNHSVTILLKSHGEIGEATYLHDLRVQCVELFPSLTSSTIRFTHGPDIKQYQEEKKLLEDYSSFVNVVYEKVGPDTHRLLNALENSRNGIQLLDLESSNLPGDKPIAIVGAGPSLDIYFETLKHHRDDFFLITVGTGLSSILSSGLRPDAHLELEYKLLARDLLKHLHKTHKFDGITLITTIEANPGFVGLFDNVLAFVPETSQFRDLYDKKTILTKGGINCANAALSVAARLAENDIFLFGIDYAFTKGEHHSRNNISQLKELPENLKALRTSVNNYTQSTISNLETVIGTKTTLNSARMVMEDTIRGIKNTIYNCSHGAKIEGSIFVDLHQVANRIEKTESLNKKIKYITLDSKYSEAKSLTIEIFKKTFTVNDAILNSLKKYNDKKEQIMRLFRVLSEIKRDFGKPHSLYQSIMSTNRLPMISLYKCLNYFNEEKAIEANEIWCTEYSEFNSEIKEILDELINGSSHYVREEWTTQNY